MLDPNPTNAQAIEQQLISLENKYWRAIKEKDLTTALSLTDEPCLVAGASGIGSLDRQSLANLMKAPYTLESFEIYNEDAQARLLRDDVAILAYRIHQKLIIDGKPVSVDSADCSTWIRRNGQWLCALHSESIKGAPYGRDRRAQN